MQCSHVSLKINILQRSGSSSKMSTAELPCYTLINVPSDFETPNEMQLKQDLEKGNTKEKIEALKKTIYMILNGEKIQGLLMNIIRFVEKFSGRQPSSS